MSAQRVRREFGAPVSFSDRNAGDVKDGYIECAPYEDKAFDLKRMELDKGTQVRAMSSSPINCLPMNLAQRARSCIADRAVLSCIVVL
jgi:hypothetical protein